jgi:hypothetical protein
MSGVLDHAFRQELRQIAAAASQPTQVLLRMHYQHLRHTGAPRPDLIDTEFRCYSQNGEDGILLYLFSVLGSTNRKVVEVCASSGIECNAANLIINHSWQGLLIDGDPDQIAVGKAFYAAHENTRFGPPTMVASWVTAENIDSLISSHGFFGDIDLLSLDLDGVDYWVWQAIQCIRPRVIVLEFNALLGPERSLTLPYDPNFRLDFSRQPYKCGASLAAFAKLGRRKGYRLIGVTALGINAFFVRDDVGIDILPTVSPQECFARVEHLKGVGPVQVDMMFADGQRWDEV